jgi:hypothetical protein
MIVWLVSISGAVLWVIKEDAKSGIAEDYGVEFGEIKDGRGQAGELGKSQR